MENTPQVPEPQKENSNLKIKNYIAIACAAIFVCIILYNECINPTKKPELDKTAMVDTIQAAKDKEIQDSIAKVKEAENQATIKKLKNNFRIEKDEFEEIAWVYHKSSAKYTNMNSVHIYFEQSKSKPAYNLRFRVQYEDDDWLFIQKMIFNIDGENLTLYPSDMERDCGNGGRIWEWCDEPASKNTLLVSKISNAKSVKIKLVGKQYHDTRKMSNTQLKAFKETLQYYIALGGEL